MGERTSRSSHAFLFRHCMRSTESTYSFHTTDDNRNNGTEYATRISPDWQTPMFWCTEAGMQQMTSTGEHILQEIIHQVQEQTKRSRRLRELDLERRRRTPSLPSIGPEGQRRLNHSNDIFDNHEIIETTKTTSTPTTPPHRIHVRFLVDSYAQRDVDSALALSRGMQNAAMTYYLNATTSSKEDAMISITGLDNLDFAPRIFKPLDATVYSSTMTSNSAGPQQQQQQQHALCNDTFLAEMTVAELQAEVQHRLDTLPLPTLLSLVEAANLVIRAGIVYNDTMNNATTTATTVAVVDEKRHVHVTGPMNFVKLGAQMLFYSRASHLRFAWSNATLDATTNTSSTFPTMQPCDITNAQLYGLLQWHYWMRSILNVGTRRTAVTGASLTRSMQEALAILDDDETSDNDNDNVTTITLLVGHDGDLNALATAWGLAWTLDAPYATVPEWYATPPGSALHATRTQLTVTQTATTTANNASKTTVPSSHKATTTAVQDTIEVSYLYPVYSLDESANIDLRQASVSFPASAMVSGINVTLPTTKHLVVQHATFVDYKDWQARVKSMLKLYPGATECYEAAAVEFQSLMATNAKGTTTTPAPNTASTTAPSVTVAATASSSQFWQRSIIALACSNVLLVLILLRQCCRRRDSKQTSPEYNAVSNCSAVHNTYLT